MLTTYIAILTVYTIRYESLHNCETSNEKISWLKYASNKFVKFWLNLYKNIKKYFLDLHVVYSKSVKVFKSLLFNCIN